jgi:cell division septation protein DedD
MRRNALIAAAMFAGAIALTGLSGCSREKIDWKSAEAADTVAGYDHFIERHPDSALVTQARARVAQLNEDRDWKRATAADTADAYRQFLTQHENGKWAEEARIRIENFALDGTATGPARPALDAALAAAPDTATAAAATRGPGETRALSGAAAVPAAVSAPASAAAPAASASLKPTTASRPSAPAAAKPSPAPRVAATTAKPTAAPTSPGSFGIQLGAFHTQDAALKNWKQLRVKYDADLHGLFAHAVPVKQTSGQLFRLQAPVGEESRARAICASLARQSQPCVVVLPQPQVAGSR